MAETGIPLQQPAPVHFPTLQSFPFPLPPPILTIYFYLFHCNRSKSDPRHPEARCSRALKQLAGSILSLVSNLRHVFLSLFVSLL